MRCIYIYIHLDNRMSTFFWSFWQDLVEYGELTNFFGHMPVSGRMWLQAASEAVSDPTWISKGIGHISSYQRSMGIQWTLFKDKDSRPWRTKSYGQEGGKQCDTEFVAPRWHPIAISFRVLLASTLSLFVILLFVAILPQRPQFHQVGPEVCWISLV